MNEQDMGRALLRGEDPIDVAALTNRVLRRDRRRVGMLTAFCLLAWTLVVMIPIGTVLPAINRYGEANGISQGGQTMQREEVQIALRILRQSTLAAFSACAVTIAMAAVTTVLLITISRRATLRQVNARLAEISSQLADLAGKRKN